MHKRSFGKGITLDLKINDLIQGIEVFFKCIKWVNCFQLQGPQSRPGFLTYQVSFTWVPTYLGQNWAEDGSDIPVLELIRLALLKKLSIFHRENPNCVGTMSTKPTSVRGLLLTSLSSTASQPRSSRHNLPPGIRSGKEHGGTSGGSTRTCSSPECCPQPLWMERTVSDATLASVSLKELSRLFLFSSQTTAVQLVRYDQ